MSRPVDSAALTPLEVVQGVLDLMSLSSLPNVEWDDDTISPYTNGYSMWFIGRENFTGGDARRGQMIGTAPLKAEEILARIEARHGD